MCPDAHVHSLANARMSFALAKRRRVNDFDAVFLTWPGRVARRTLMNVVYESIGRSGRVAPWDLRSNYLL